MKICDFCNIENADEATICPSCGGNKFKHKCGNCGTIYDNANYCPRCGTKAGAKAKKCPNCGCEYYSLACPDCGFTRNNHNTESNYEPSSPSHTNVYAQPVKRRKTWLWVLGWIFIFPVPLTVLMIQNEKLSKVAKVLIIIAVWILYFALAATGDNSSEASTTLLNL